jgi:hypothetical protein
LPIRILFTFTGSFEGLETLYDIAKSPVGDIVEGGTDNDLTDTENDLRETGSGLGVAENDVAETEDALLEQVAEQEVPEIVLEDADKVGEWHTS